MNIIVHSPPPERSEDDHSAQQQQQQQHRHRHQHQHLAQTVVAAEDEDAIMMEEDRDMEFARATEVPSNNPAKPPAAEEAEPESTPRRFLKTFQDAVKKNNIIHKIQVRMEEKDSVVGHGGDLREELGRAAEGVRHLRERFVRARPNSVSDPLDRVAAEQAHQVPTGQHHGYGDSASATLAPPSDSSSSSSSSSSTTHEPFGTPPPAVTTTSMSIAEEEEENRRDTRSWAGTSSAAMQQ